jgi:hypothetical protein
MVEPAPTTVAPPPAPGDRVELTSGEHGLVVAAGEGEVAVYPGDDGEATAGVQLWAIDHVRVRARALYLDVDDEAMLRDLLRRDVAALAEVPQDWKRGVVAQRIDRLRSLLTRGARDGQPAPTR